MKLKELIEVLEGINPEMDVYFKGLPIEESISTFAPTVYDVVEVNKIFFDEDTGKDIFIL